VKFCIGGKLGPRDDSFHVCMANRGAAWGTWSGDSKVGAGCRSMADGGWARQEVSRFGKTGGW